MLSMAHAATEALSAESGRRSGFLSSGDGDGDGYGDGQEEPDARRLIRVWVMNDRRRHKGTFPVVATGFPVVATGTPTHTPAMLVLVVLVIPSTSIIAIPTEIVREGLVYHTPRDTVEHIEPAVVEACMRIVLRFLEEYSLAFR